MNRKKLIEVSIPLQAINVESAKDASLTHGHPSTLHRYWARRPLAACRAVIFASMVDDPAECPDEFPTKAEQSAQRTRLHTLIKRLVVWQNSNDTALLAEARYEIARSVARNNGVDMADFQRRFQNDPEAVLAYLNEHCPAVYDPFCGGGSIPLEAQRLGLRARGSDLNPLPVLLNKAMIELPPKFHDQHPVNPDADPLGVLTGTGKRQKHTAWRGTAGLADDIRYYGAWMREAASRQIGHLYPQVELSDGTKATVVAWLWARTVPCNNPACGLQMPLMPTFQICKKKGNRHWTRPVVDRDTNTISWVVQTDDAGVPKPTVNRTGAYCCGCGSAVRLPYVREQARAGRIGEVMTAVVAEGDRRKLYLPPPDAHVHVARSAEPNHRPRGKLPLRAISIRPHLYGFLNYHQLFTERQLTALNTFTDVLPEARAQMIADGADGEYATAVCTYLSLAVGRTAETWCSLALWMSKDECISKVFARQAIPMSWDYAEANPFSDSTQNWGAQIEWVAKAVGNLPPSANPGEAHQADATTTQHAVDNPVIVTDPPYYDNIDYAVISDFFYVWLRPLLRDAYLELFASMQTPKDEEIVAAPRFENPAAHFEGLLGQALEQICQHAPDAHPTSIFYAYRQQETEKDGVTSTGWETMLKAVVEAGFQIVATWPLRTEQVTGIKTTINALAASIVLVCRPRPKDAPSILRRDFMTELKEAMPPELNRLTRIADIRPVDLAQAAIGPGMAVYSRYSSVTRISGEPVPIREVLMYINDEISAYHEKETGKLDAVTQFCLTWLQQHGYTEGTFGDAEGLSKAKSTDLKTMHERVLLSGRGKVRLLKPEEYAERDLSPDMSAWEGCQRMLWHLSRVEAAGGIMGCGAVARAMGDDEPVRELARILYAYYERRGEAERASRYNHLVQEWGYISQAARSAKQTLVDFS